MQDLRNDQQYDVFLSHSHEDAEWVENLAIKLVEEAKLKVWLDKWILVPGEEWQKALARGIAQATSCAVCISDKTPKGWFDQEIQKALNRQAQDKKFRVIPVLLPGVKNIDYLKETFVELRTWIDFRPTTKADCPLHRLTCGIKGEAPDRCPPQDSKKLEDTGEAEIKLEALKKLSEKKLISDDCYLDFQKELVAKHLDEIIKVKRGLFR